VLLFELDRRLAGVGLLIEKRQILHGVRGGGYWGRPAAGPLVV
jgi:hypothetical protein